MNRQNQVECGDTFLPLSSAGSRVPQPLEELAKNESVSENTQNESTSEWPDFPMTRVPLVHLTPEMIEWAKSRGIASPIPASPPRKSG